MNRIRPVISLGIICILTIVITGCNLFKKDSKTVTEVSKSKDLMIEKLDNYNLIISIINQTLVGTIDIKMNCVVDNKNKLEYCRISTLGLDETEQYIDYNNKKMYTRSNSLGNEWDVTDIKNININPWVSITDYLKDVTSTKQNDGKLYKANINVNKLVNAIIFSDKASKLKLPTTEIKKVPIEIYINKDGYIENIDSTFDLAAFKETINIKFHNFNGNKDLELPNI